MRCWVPATRCRVPRTLTLEIMKKPIKYLIVILGGIVAVPALLFGYLFVAYVFTLAQWMLNGYDNKKPKTREELERHIILETPKQYGSFTNLQYGMMHYWNEEKGVYQGATRAGDYTPKSGDKYYTYRVLGIMPIDAVFDSNDNTILVFQTFDH